MYYKVLQRDGIPFLREVSNETALQDAGFRPTKQLAVKDYLDEMIACRYDYLANINRNMNRLTSCQRRIRQAKNLIT